MAATSARLLDEALYRFMLMILGTWSLAAAGIALYLVKSALGINLFDEPSFLHPYFFN
jgi:hypothetical protein